MIDLKKVVLTCLLLMQSTVIYSENSDASQFQQFEISKRATYSTLRAELLDFGVYQFQVDENKKRRIAHTSWETNIKLQQGLLVGFRVKLTGDLEDKSDFFEIHHIRPDRVNANQRTTRLIHEVTVKRIMPPAIESVFYHFGNADEMTPGLWNFEVHYRGRVIAMKQFQFIQ